MPSDAKTSASIEPASGSSGPTRRGPASITVTSDPKRRNTWASSTPMAPPPRTANESGTRAVRTASRLLQYGVATQAGDRRHPGSGPGPEHHGPLRLEGLVADHDPAGAVETGPAAHEPTALAHEAVHGDRVVPIVRGLVADAAGDWAHPGAPWPNRPTRRPSSTRPGGSTPGSSSSTARTPSRDIRRPRARRRCRPRRGRLRPAARPRPHHRVPYRPRRRPRLRSSKPPRSGPTSTRPLGDRSTHPLPAVRLHSHPLPDGSWHAYGAHRPQVRRRRPPHYRGVTESSASTPASPPLRWWSFDEILRRSKSMPTHPRGRGACRHAVDPHPRRSDDDPPEMSHCRSWRGS